MAFRYLSTVAVTLALSWALAFHATAQEKIISNQSDIYAEYDTCEGYTALLAGEVPKDSKGCDDVSRFLISKREDNMAVFLNDYLTDMARKTPFAYLVAGIKDWKLYGQSAAGSSFYMIDFANTQLFTASRGVGDIERAVIYGFLAISARMQIFSGELSATSDVLKTYQQPPVQDLLGDQFSMLDRVPPDNVLVCMLIADNQRVAVAKVVTSQYFQTCLKNNTTEK